jgi:hypothetical protein
MAAIAIRGRADEIRPLFTHIGLFEWVAWAIHKKVDVQMLFGSNVVALRTVFAAGMPQHSLSCCRVAAVRCSKGHPSWLSAVRLTGELHPDINHYVIGVACGLQPAVCSGRRPSESALKEALRAGWILRPTEAKGNCGIDVMCHHLGLPRNRTSWTNIRKDIADLMIRVADDPAWHCVFRACDEMPARAAIPKKGGLGTPEDSLAAWAAVACKAASSMPRETSLTAGASSLLAAKPAPATALAIAASSFGAAAPAPPHSLTIAASSLDAAGPASSTSSASASPPLPPPPLPPPVDGPPDLVASVPVTVAGPRAFAGYLQTCTADQLQTMTASVKEFVAAEAKWRAEHPSHAAAEAQPRRKNVAYLVNFKYATGLAYLEWFKHTGRGSRAALKDCSVQLVAPPLGIDQLTKH